MFILTKHQKQAHWCKLEYCNVPTNQKTLLVTAHTFNVDAITLEIFYTICNIAKHKIDFTTYVFSLLPTVPKKHTYEHKHTETYTHIHMYKYTHTYMKIQFKE